jgi:hypothetical protein
MIDKIMVWLFGNYYVLLKIFKGLKERGLCPRYKHCSDTMSSCNFYMIKFRIENEWCMIKFCFYDYWEVRHWEVELSIGNMIYDWNIDAHCFCVYDLYKMGYKEFLSKIDRFIEFFKLMDGSILDSTIYGEYYCGKIINSCLNDKDVSVEDWIEKYILENITQLKYLNKSNLEFQEKVLKRYPERINEIKNLDPGLKEKYSHLDMGNKFGIFAE